MPTPTAAKRLLVDTNLLVLLVVGTVNPDRIEKFGRTSSYTRETFDLLRDTLDAFQEAFTVAHVMAEVSNLTKLAGNELSVARQTLAGIIEELVEPPLPSADAARDLGYPRLGLTDSSITRLAELHQCTVLTDDLMLYLHLEERQIPVIYFTHLRAAAGLA